MNIEKILKEHSLRVTQERVDIFQHICGCHIFSCNDLLEKFPDIGRASVFRTLKLFLEL